MIINRVTRIIDREFYRSTFISTSDPSKTKYLGNIVINVAYTAYDNISVSSPISFLTFRKPLIVLFLSSSGKNGSCKRESKH